MKFYTADPHWDHANIIKLCKRPFSDLKEMQDVMVHNWNSVVSDEDDVYIAGDFTFKANVFAEFALKLNGVKHFISGNHDDEAYKKARNMNLPKCVFHPFIHKIHDNNHSVVLCHYPIYEWEGYYKGAIHLHGHTHGNIGKSFKDRAYDIGMDVWNYKPVTLGGDIK